MMRIQSHLKLTAALIAIPLVLSGCFSGISQRQYVNSADSNDHLTLKTVITAKSRLISTVHGVQSGTYTIEDVNGVAESGSYTINSEGFRFTPEGRTGTLAKIGENGSFDYANRTWLEANAILEKSLVSTSGDQSLAASH